MNQSTPHAVPWHHATYEDSWGTPKEGHSTHHGDSNERLHSFLLANRAPVHKTTNTMPTSMVFRKEIYLPWDLLFLNPPPPPNKQRHNCNQLNGRTHEMAAWHPPLHQSKPKGGQWLNGLLQPHSQFHGISGGRSSLVLPQGWSQNKVIQAPHPRKAHTKWSPDQQCSLLNPATSEGEDDSGTTEKTGATSTGYLKRVSLQT